MKRYAGFILIAMFALLLAPAFQSEEPKNRWNTTLSMSRNRFLPGEPIEVGIESRTILGTPLPIKWIQGQFLLDGTERCEMPTCVAKSRQTWRPVELVSSGAFQYHDPEQSTNINVFWLNTGCQSWRIGRPGLVGKHRFCFHPGRNGWQSREESCVTFEITQPAGADAAAFKLLPSSIKNLATESITKGPLPKEILERYPTSTYAGYVLLGMGPGGGWAWSFLERSLDDITRYQKERPARFAQLSAFPVQAQAFLNLHPDFLEAALLRHQMVIAFLLTGNQKEGIEQLRVIAGMGDRLSCSAHECVKRWEEIQAQKARQAADAEVSRHFKGEPMQHLDEVIKLYPNSDYAATALWEKGYAEFHDTDMESSTPRRDFNLGSRDRAEYAGCPVCECAKGKPLCLTIPYWERLYREYPHFQNRLQLLLSMSRVYFLTGTPEKAVPLLQELLSKFPESIPGKQAVAYKDVLKAHGLWPE